MVEGEKNVSKGSSSGGIEEWGLGGMHKKLKKSTSWCEKWYLRPQVDLL